MRRTRNWQLSVLILASLLLTPYTPKADTLHLTAVYWPPYAGPTLPEQGAAVYVIKKALSAMGHEVKVDFYGAGRASKLAGKHGSKYLGYLPVYEYQNSDFVFSRPIATSPIGLVEMKLHPLSWLEMDDLRNFTLGVGPQVLGIPEVSPWLESDKQPKREATSDLQNIRMVATARVDGAVMDMNVAEYLLKSDSLPGVSSKLQFGRRLLAEPSLFVAFQRSEEGRRWLDILNQGLNTLDTQALLDAYWRELNN